MTHLYKYIRPFLFLLPAEFSHNLSLKALKLINRLGLLKSKAFDKQTFNCHGLTFKNKLGLAAGLDKNGDYISELAKLGFGFIEVGTVTPKPQKGNVKPRLFRLVRHQAIVNRFGFNNKGVHHLVNNLKKAKNRTFVLGANIGKNKDTPVDKAVDDYLYCLNAVYPYADYVTINISSPNTEGLRELQNLKNLDNLMLMLKKAQANLTDMHHKKSPMFLKFAPDLSKKEIDDIAKLCIKHDIEGIIVSNTTIALDELRDKKHYQQGGLSGKPLYQMSNKTLQLFHDVLQKLDQNHKITIIGTGGIDSGQSAIGKLQCGADLVQIYSGLIYQGPKLVDEILSINV
ncbi:quinone-dependent dihydroorotate dehydrogenase [Facilibium subflavum]|uniref:quinone-dependent dihydroorotate dehydrogenase n=1 Tax=Facilibium subflavum TaxID=2219058 RepID=UPI000E648BAE|nr:quinone-dependent dihydroorotate dehydrogenase [Facilibium subflavum]